MCARRPIRQFSDKNCKRRGIKIYQERCTKKTGLLDLLTGSGRPCAHIPQLCAAAWLMVQLTNGQHTFELVFKPKADILNTHRDYQFLFSLYLINFMFHTMLDAAGGVLRVDYKSMKCDVLFSQGSVRTIFR